MTQRVHYTKSWCWTSCWKLQLLAFLGPTVWKWYYYWIMEGRIFIDMTFIAQIQRAQVKLQERYRLIKDNKVKHNICHCLLSTWSWGSCFIIMFFWGKVLNMSVRLLQKYDNVSLLFYVNVCVMFFVLM